MTSPATELRDKLTAALPDMTSDEIAILDHLYEYQSATVARFAKDLDLGQSRIRRALSMLGPEIGVGLVEYVEGDAGGVRLSAAGVTFLSVLAD